MVVNEIKPMKCSESKPWEEDRITVRTLDLNKDLDIYIAHPQFCGKKTQDATKPNYICTSSTIKAGQPNAYNAITRQPVSTVELKVEIRTRGEGLVWALFVRSYEVYVWDNSSKQMYVRKYVKPGCSLTFPEDFTPADK